MGYQHIGILGVSAEGAALCYRTICVEAGRRLGGEHHPQVTMHTNDLGEIFGLSERGDWEKIGDWLLDSAEKLARVGAEFLVCPDNTVHQTLDMIRERLPLPLVHIAEVVADEAQRRGYRTVGLTGTRWLMDGPVYPAQFERRGIAMVLPTAEQRRRIHEIIVTELLHGVIRPESLAELQEMIRDLRRRGCDAVALSCTELPLILTPETSPLPVLDSTRLLARAALDRALDAREGMVAAPAG